MEQTPEEYFQALEQKARSRKGIFVNSTTAHRQTRQGRGTTPGPYQGYPGLNAESNYDEAYGPPNLVRRGGGYTGSGASTYDEGLQARKNSRDDAREAEAKAKVDPPKKKRKKKSK
jgi:hypothetical protein